MIQAILHRLKYDEFQTQGIFNLYNDEIDLLFACNTLELPWDANKRESSCIPKGQYKVSPRLSDRYGDHFILEAVPNRTEILIHWGNYHRDTLGCILIGAGFTDMDRDGSLDVTASRSSLRALNAHSNRKSFLLKII